FENFLLPVGAFRLGELVGLAQLGPAGFAQLVVEDGTRIDGGPDARSDDALDLDRLSLLGTGNRRAAGRASQERHFRTATGNDHDGRYELTPLHTAPPASSLFWHQSSEGGEL